MITISFEQAAAYLTLRVEFARRCPGAVLPPGVEAALSKMDEKAALHVTTFAPHFIEHNRAKLAEIDNPPKEPA